ncbi:O-antigen ligase family protein [Granulicella sibirica]|nr:O-antigen ligase family protein [Granulicella sibirica]
MGLFFTLFFVFTAYLGPETVFGSFAEYHVEIVIALITMFFSVFSAEGSGTFRLPQTYAIIGLSCAVFISVLMSGWAGGAPVAFLDFIPNSMPFFFVLLNCRKKSHLQMLVTVLVYAALFTTYKAYVAIQANDLESPYLLNMNTDDGHIIRIRGLSFISDPNDFAQFIVGLIPCVFFFWKKKRFLTNLLMVYVPVAGLIYGMFLTHSRGAMMALLVVVIVAGRKKLGVVPSIVGAVLLFVGLSAIGWSGGRDVSASQGEDRMGAWSRGLELIRQYPLFGVGYKRFVDHYYITAHNSIVVCAAEIGMIGFFFWVLFVFSSVRDAAVNSIDPDAVVKVKDEDLVPAGMMAYGAAAVSAREPVVLKDASEQAREKRKGFSLKNPFADTDDEVDKVAEAKEIRRLSGLMVVSFAGFLTAGWFLSRSYIMPLFVNAGIVAAIGRMGRAKGVSGPEFEMPRAMKMALITSVALITLVYTILRMNGIFGKS